MTIPPANLLTILDNIPDILVQVDINKIYVWANKSAFDFFGSDLIGKPAAFYFEGDQDTYQRVEPVFKGTDETVYVESWQRRQDGEKCLLGWWCRTLKDDQGKVIGSISTARDITLQKQTDEQLRTSERRLQKAQEMAHVGNWELDLNTQQVWGSDEAFHIYGIDNITHDLPLQTIQSLVLPEFRPILDNALHQLIFQETIYDIEFKIRRPSDSSIRDIHSIANLFKDDSGKPTKVIGIIHDVTENKQISSTLKESQIILQNIIDLLPVRIFWKDLNLNYLGCNKSFAKDAGKDIPSELIGKTDNEMGWKQQADSYRADDMKVIDTGISKLNYEEPQQTPNGQTIWLNTNKVPLINNYGKTIGVLGTYIDVTSQKLAHDQLKAKNEDLKKMNQAMVDRELKMIELKEQIKNLENQLHRS